MARSNKNHKDGKQSAAKRQGVQGATASTTVATPVAAVSPGLRSHPLFFPALCLLLFLLIALAYVWIAWITTEGSPLVLADVVDRTSIFKADDSYRFYVAKSAWKHIESYAWNYVLPLCVFFDGMLALLAQKSLFLTRCTHILPAFLTLWLVYQSGRGLGINRVLMLLSVLVLALMPLYVFVFLSFYGENWLTLFAAASTCAFVYRRYSWCALLAGCMPLIRAEGFFLMLPFWVHFLKERQFRNFVIAGLPGFFHLVSLFVILDDFRDYFHWRLWFRQVTNNVTSPFLYGNHVLSTFNPFWTLPAVAAFLMPGMRRLWPVWAGVFFWVTWISLSLLVDQLFYESRYFLSILPAIALGWAFFFQWLGRLPFFAVARKGWLFCFGLLFVFIVGEQMLQLDPLKAKYGGGQRWPLPGNALLVDHFIHYPPDELKARHKMAEVIYGVIERNPEVDSLIVFSENMLRELDPDRIPSRVRVSWAPISSDVSLDVVQNNFFVMHPGDKQYAIYHFQTLDRSKRSPVALYVGDLSCQLCTPLYAQGGYQLHAFSYNVSYEMKRIPPRNVTLDCRRSGQGEMVCRDGSGEPRDVPDGKKEAP